MLVYNKYAWLIATALQPLFTEPCIYSTWLHCDIPMLSESSAVIVLYLYGINQYNVLLINKCINKLSDHNVLHAVAVTSEMSLSVCCPHNSGNQVVQATAHYIPPYHISIIVLYILVTNMLSLGAWIRKHSRLVANLIPGNRSP